MDYKEFQQKIKAYRRNQSQKAFSENRGDIRIKKEKTVVKNLVRIFEAAIKIGNRKGFQAMSMRDLSNETSLSMGALYAYFISKDNLLKMLQRNGRDHFQKMLKGCIKRDASAIANLRRVIKTHLFMSEELQPWFYFVYMEVKNLDKAEREIAEENELYADRIIVEILEKGRSEGLFKQQDHQLTSALIKAMLNDWYLKRWKFAKRNVLVDEYADYLIDFIEPFLLRRDSTKHV